MAFERESIPSGRARSKTWRDVFATRSGAHATRNSKSRASSSRTRASRRTDGCPELFLQRRDCETHLRLLRGEWRTTSRGRLGGVSCEGRRAHPFFVSRLRSLQDRFLCAGTRDARGVERTRRL